MGWPNHTGGSFVAYKVNFICNKHNSIFEMRTLRSGHWSHSNLSQPGQSRFFKQWQSAGAVEAAATVDSVNGLDCKWIGRKPALQITANNSHCRARADGITQPPSCPSPPLHFHPASEESVWISYMSISYVMNTNMTNLRLTVKLWQSSLEK